MLITSRARMVGVVWASGVGGIVAERVDEQERDDMQRGGLQLMVTNHSVSRSCAGK
jgi:hypothetical protein